MTCTPFRDPAIGFSGIVCTGRSRRCKFCGNASTKLCDWKTPLVVSRRSGTCDAPMCDRCAHRVGRDKDLCPTHAAAWKSHPANMAK